MNLKNKFAVLLLFTSLFGAAAWLALPAQAANDTRRDWNKKKWGPIVPHTKFPKDCSLCHLPNRWDKLREDFKFDHLKETGYALDGSHTHAACLRCHNDRGDVKAYAIRGCAGCHGDPHKSTLGPDCKRCHNLVTWQPTGILANHARSGFPLTGQHAATLCEQCHKSAPAGDFKGAPMLCYGCHMADYQRAPNHSTMHFATTCEKCHNTSNWNAVRRFDHSTLGPNPNCVSCHLPNYQSAPNHVARNFPQTCANCHNTSSWTGARFNHSALGANPVCYNCHQANYQSATNHVAQNYSTSCQNCHNTTSWIATLNHTFPQNHGNATSCTSCHQGPATSTNYTCLTCHAQAKMADTHKGRSGYSYSSPACLGCHPRGRKP